MKYTLIQLADITAWYSFRWSIKEDINWNYLVFQAKNISDCTKKQALLRMKMDKINTNALIEPWDVLLSSRWLFRSCVAQSYKDQVVASLSVFIIRIKSNVIDPEYLSIFLNSKIWQRSIQTITTWTSIKTILKSDLASIKIIVPSLEKQAQIINLYNNWVFQKDLLQRKINYTNNIVEGAINHLLTK